MVPRAQSFCRKFVWHRECLWPEELPGAAMLVLAAQDDLVPSALVRAMLARTNHPCEVPPLLFNVTGCAVARGPLGDLEPLALPLCSCLAPGVALPLHVGPTCLTPQFLNLKVQTVKDDKSPWHRHKITKSNQQYPELSMLGMSR